MSNVKTVSSSNQQGQLMCPIITTYAKADTSTVIHTLILHKRDCTNEGAYMQPHRDTAREEAAASVAERWTTPPVEQPFSLTCFPHACLCLCTDWENKHSVKESHGPLIHSHMPSPALLHPGATGANTWSEPLKSNYWKRVSREKQLRGAVPHSNQRRRQSLCDLRWCHLRIKKITRKN